MSNLFYNKNLNGYSIGKIYPNLGTFYYDEGSVKISNNK